MDIKTTLLLLFMAPALSGYANDCQLAYQQASYGLEHSEKAMASNNIEHLKQYAERSTQALTKAYNYARECGCSNAKEAAYDALDDFEKALGYETFEKARYYTKEGLKRTREVLSSLDICEQQTPDYALQNDEANLALQEQLLLEQQQRLREKQRQLEEQLRKQEALQQKIQREKEAKLSAQFELKEEAEARLSDLQAIMNEVLSTVGCGDSVQLDQLNYNRTKAQLEDETLQASRQFYSRKAQELVNSFRLTLVNCNLR